MTRIAVDADTFSLIAAMRRPREIAFEVERTAQGEQLIWFDPSDIDKPGGQPMDHPLDSVATVGSEEAGREHEQPDHPKHESMTARPPTRRGRRLSFRDAEKQAGRPIASVTEHADGSRTLAFGETVEAAKPEPSSEDDPPSRSLFKIRAKPKIKVVL